MPQTSTGKKQKAGRPRVAGHLARPHRVVTFVGDDEKQALQRLAVEEDRSLAYVVYQIIRAHLKET